MDFRIEIDGLVQILLLFMGYFSNHMLSLRKTHFHSLTQANIFVLLVLFA